MVQNSRVQEIHVVRDAEASDNSVTVLEKADDIAEAAINSCQFYSDTLLATGSRLLGKKKTLSISLLNSHILQ